jgi:type IV secretory pathway TraG/TraD family ATPase VirD4
MGKPLLRADEIRTLADGQAILLSGNLRPLLFAMPPYYAVDTLLNRSQEPPAHGSGATVAYLPLGSEAQPELPGMTDPDALRFSA